MKRIFIRGFLCVCLIMSGRYCAQEAQDDVALSAEDFDFDLEDFDLESEQTDDVSFEPVETDKQADEPIETINEFDEDTESEEPQTTDEAQDSPAGSESDQGAEIETDTQESQPTDDMQSDAMEQDEIEDDGAEAAPQQQSFDFEVDDEDESFALESESMPDQMEQEPEQQDAMKMDEPDNLDQGDFALEVPAAPEPIEQTMVESDQDAEIEGIDTVDLDSPQGNWLFKRIWWERAERQYEKIRGGVQEIFEMRLRFFAGRNELDKAVLDPFYIAIGLSQGELQGLLKELINALEKAREEQGSLSAAERSVLETLEQEEQVLEQLQNDVRGISALDSSIDEALSQLMEQINRVREYDRNAWEAFKEIARVLDDTKARELYYQVDTAWRNVKDIRDYVSATFGSHFDELVNRAREQVERVQSAVAALKEKGIDFKLQIEMLTQGPPKPQRPAEMDDDDEDDEIEESGGIISSITSTIGSVFGSIWGIIRMPYDMIFGGSGDVDEEDEIDFDDE